MRIKLNLKMTFMKIALLFGAFVLEACDGYKVLVIFPMPAKSHMILGDGVVKHLLNAGHEVTLVTSFKNNSTNPMLHVIDVSRGSNFFRERPKDIMSLKNVLDGVTSNAWMKNFMLLMGNQISSSILRDENFQKMLAEKNHEFDVVIAEWFFNELFGTIGAIYNAPFIWVSTIEPHWMILRLIDEGLNPAYNGYDVTDKPPFTFGQRVQELWSTIKQLVVKYTIGRYLDSKSYTQLIVPHFKARGRVPPSFEELQYNASLILGNSHVSMGEAKRLPQNYINIGGYHIEEKTKPLPDDLKSIIERAKHGVIYFSMGSNLRSKDLPEVIKHELLDVFGSLKQTVIWKFEEKIADLPKNVFILDWAPQQSILPHPNVILFITHGGLLSTTEAIYAGKPIIGIPVLTDQFVNVARAVSNGFALKVDLTYNMAAKLKEAIEKILTNSTYAERAKHLSFIHHDRPIKPGDEMVHWVEHVIKTKGAPHLRSPALLIPWYQKIYLDLVTLIVLMFIILIRVFKYVKSPTAKSKKSWKQKMN